MMISLFHKTRTLLVGICLCLFSSCGLFDIDTDELVEVASTFSMGRDTVYVMQGEHFVFSPTFEPDTLANMQVYYYSLADSVAVMVGDTVVAKSEGWVTVVGISVSSRMTDSCHVCVLPLWQPTLQYYPYETVFYAKATVQGIPIDDNMTVAAFCGNEIRGIGQVYEQKGVRCLRIRVGSENIDLPDEYEDADDEDESTEGGAYAPHRERIVFRCYDRHTHNLYTSPTRVVFDGETHGTPSSLFDLKL